MTSKLLVRLSIVSLYFILDIGYTLWKIKGQIVTTTIIEKSLLFLGVSIAVYLITYKENSQNKTSSP